MDGQIELNSTKLDRNGPWAICQKFLSLWINGISCTCIHKYIHIYIEFLTYVGNEMLITVSLASQSEIYSIYTHIYMISLLFSYPFFYYFGFNIVVHMLFNMKNNNQYIYIYMLINPWSLTWQFFILHTSMYAKQLGGGQE